MVGALGPRLDPAALEALRARPNVHFIGPVARDEVPSHLLALDCLLMPYLEDEWARHGSPLKFWEYLYAGVPIAASGYTALLDYPPPLVHFASPPERLAEAVSAALAAGTADRQERRSFALANTWDDRAAEFESLAERALAGRASRPL
jgi:glycosyltransferase involved in cell wall biosynthesis